MTDQRKTVAEQIFGDNKAPIETVLRADFADLMATVDETLARFDEAPAEVKSEEDMIAIGTIITDARKVVKEIEQARTDEGKPLFDAKRTLDGFFKDLTGKIDAAQKRVTARADKYTRQKEAEAREIARRRAEEARRAEEEARRRAEAAKSAEAGGRAAARAETLSAQADEQQAAAEAASSKISAGGVTASARKTWNFHIDDYAALDLNDLKPFIDRKAVEAAIRSMVRIQKDMTRLKGVTVYQDTKTAFRG